MFEQEKISVIHREDGPHSPLGMKHLSVVIDHQSRNFSFYPLAVLVGFLRFLVATLMVGSVDEYWKDGELVAWSQSLWKGNTMR